MNPIQTDIIPVKSACGEREWRLPAQAEIATRAHELWCLAGRPWGREQEFWYRAESELAGNVLQIPVERPLTTPDHTGSKTETSSTVVTPTFDGDLMKVETVPARRGDTQTPSLAAEVDRALAEQDVPARERRSPTSAAI